MTRLGTDFRVLAINTPEGVRFHIPLAGPTIRFLAWFIDALVINGSFGVCARGLNALRAVNSDVASALMFVVYFLLTIGYPIAMEWMWRGQTVGKRMFGLRVIDANGKRLEFAQILLRNILRVVDVLPIAYLVGGASLVLTKRCQRLGDMVADTVVIRQRKLAFPTIAEAGNPEKFNSLLGYPHLAARLRQAVPAALAHIAMEAIIRRDELAPEARIAVFAALAKQLETYVGFPEEAVAGMADERYVRNCLEIVLNTGNLRRHVISS